MQSPPESLRRALAQRYELDDAIGSGGMATVYRARDVKHSRLVAVKVLKPDLAAIVGTDRFLREIEIIAQLNHPHILPLIDSDEVEGYPYFVMPLVAGESLRQLLNRERHLDPGRTLPIVREVAGALGYAHRQGVVHRDIKPENILLSEGHAVVTDFGIARAVITAGTEKLTRSGFPLGTIGYMSPEQAAGAQELDARTDVYSLACVTYEMLVGDVPGLWVSDESYRMRRFGEVADAHRRRLDLLPGAMEQVLVRSMALQPAQRVATPEEFATALEASMRGDVRFDDGQSRLILQRAVELQLSHPTGADALSLGGIQRAAAEAGIAPEHVSEAAAGLRQGPPTLTRGGILGYVPNFELERFVEGRTTEAQHAALLEEMRITLGEVGELNETLGTSLAWSSSPRGTSERRAHILVSSQGDRTRLRVVDREGTPTAVALVPIVGGSLVVLGVTGAIVASAGAPALVAAAAAVTAASGISGSLTWALRRSFRHGLERRLATLNRLMDNLAGLIERRDPAPGNTPADPA